MRVPANDRRVPSQRVTDRNRCLGDRLAGVRQQRVPLGSLYCGQGDFWACFLVQAECPFQMPALANDLFSQPVEPVVVVGKVVAHQLV